MSATAPQPSALFEEFSDILIPAPGSSPAENHNMTTVVKTFYEETPFPNYNGLDSRESLADKARREVFAPLLDQQLPQGAFVFEATFGTGQLSNFHRMSWRRKVFAGDVCLNSLPLARRFAEKYSIRNVAFSDGPVPAPISRPCI